MKHYSSLSYRVFTICNLAFITFVAVICMLPLLHILAVSLSGKGPAAANLVGLWPVEFNFSAYKAALSNQAFIHSFEVAIKRVILGVITNMILIVLMAYPLSKDSSVLPFRILFTWLLVFTMLFNDGLIPNYMLVNQLGLMNSI